MSASKKTAAHNQTASLSKKAPRLREADPTWPAPETTGAILDALPANIALVDPSGIILSVNASWRKFGSANALQGSDFFVGRNYLEICDGVAGECAADAHAAAAGIRRVLTGELPEFVLEYACHTPDEQRWFRLMVSPLQPGHQAGAVLMHVNITDRKRAELALSQSEQANRHLASQLEAERSQLVSAQDVAKIGSWETDQTTLAVIWSEQVHCIFETDPAIFRPTHQAFLDFVHPDDRAAVDAAFAASWSDTEIHTIEHRIVLPGGREKFIEEHWRIFPATTGRSARAIGTCRDITAQRKTEQSLRDSEAQLRRASRIAQLGSWELTLATGKLQWSEEIYRISGLAPENFGATFDAFLATVHPDDRGQMQAAQQRALTGTAGLDHQHRIVRPDGTVRWVHEQAELERDESGRPVRLTGTMLDITERRQAQSERETLFNLSDDLLAVIDFDGPIEQVNPAWTKTLGWTPAELIGRPAADFILPEDRERTLRAREGLKQGRPLRNLENRYRCKDGSYRWLSWSSRPLMETRQVYAVARDITEQKQAEERLEALRSMAKMASRLARIGAWSVELPELKSNWSDEICAIHGVPAGHRATLGETVAFYAPEFRPVIAEAFDFCRREGRSFDLEAQIINTAGRRVWVRVMGEAVRNDAGVITQVHGAFQDINEQRLAAETLKQKDALLRIAGRVTRTGGWALELPDQQVFWSDEVYDMLGLTRGRPIPLGVALKHYPPVWRLTVVAAIKTCAERGTPFDLEVQILTTAGQPLWVRVAGEAERDATGTIRRVQGAFQNITERHERDIQLHLLEASVARLNDSVLITEASPLDEPGPRIIFVNDAFERLSGYRREEVIGRSPRFLQGPRTSRPELDRLKTALRQKTPIRVELINYAKDGTEYWVELSMAPVVTDRGEITHFVAVERDISERKRTETALQRNSELLTDMVDALQEIATSRLPLQETITLMAKHAQNLTGAAGAIIEFVEGDELVYRAATGRAQPSLGLRLARQGSLSGQAVQQGIALLCEDSETDDRVDRAACRRAGVRSMVVAPLRAGEQIIGVLKIMSDRPRAFSPQDMGNLQILVESLGATIQRHQANELLQASEEQYRLLFADNPHPMWVYDTESYRFLAVNTSAQSHYGYTEEEFLAMTILDIRPAEDAAALRLELSALRGELSVRRHGIYRHYKKDGTLIQVETTSSSISFGDRPARLVLAQDITSRIQSEQEAARSTRALQMLSQCNEALIRTEREKDLLTAICQIVVEVGGMRMAWVGYATDDATRSIIPQAHAGVENGYLGEVELSWAEDRPAGQGPAGLTIRGGVPMVVPDFSQLPTFRRWLQNAQARGYAGVICLPLKDPERTFGVLALYLPETRPVPAEELRLMQELADNLAFGIGNLRVRAERRLNQQKLAQQAALIDKATDAIFVRDLEHRITFWSQGAERLYGWSAAEATGRSLAELLRIDPVAFAEAERALMARGEWNGETTKTAKDGTVLTIDGRWNLLRDDDGQPRAILTIDTNVTERKKLEAQFLRAQRMESIGTLAGGIAHDLNNLLAPIMMGVGLIRQFTPDEKVLTVVKNIERSAQRGTDLVRQVLSFARGVEGARVTIQLDHIVREIESIAAHTFPKNIAFVRDLPKDLRLVVGDPTQLNQVVLNLCVNARDAMPDGGRLVVSARNVEIDEQYAVMNRGVAPGNYVALEVTDNGCGMPREVVDRIFEPFFTTKELGKGTGLGLSTVLGIVRSHGGFVNVYSEVGKGSTFKVYLPVPADQLAAAPAAGEVESLPRGQGELILLVDDESSILSITRQTLETFGYRVITAEDGAQAIGLYAQSRTEIAAVLTDMMMPVMDGPALIAAIRRVNPAARIIAASGLNANGNVARAAQAGVKHFMAKPYTADALLAMLRQVLTEKSSRPPFAGSST